MTSPVDPVTMTAARVHNLEALPERKNPLIAALVGFFFGAIGVAVYFRSVRDFVVCVVSLIGFTFAIPVGGAPIGWLFAAGYGFFRAVTSNQELERAAP